MVLFVGVLDASKTIATGDVFRINSNNLTIELGARLVLKDRVKETMTTTGTGTYACWCSRWF